MDLKDFLKIGTTGLTGLFAGCALYVNTVSSPAGETFDLQNCRKNWKENFLRAKNVQVRFYINLYTLMGYKESRLVKYKLVK
jgi:hypothetical protein